MRGREYESQSANFVQPTLEKRTIKNGLHGQQQKARVVCGSNKSFARYSSRYGRFVWAGRSLALTLSLLCLALHPTLAYAAGYSWGTVDGPFTTGHSGHDSGYVVLNVSNKYDAALCVIGKGSDKIQLTSDEFALLSNAETGGAFYELANEFFAISGSEGGNSYAAWWGDIYFQILSVQAAGGEGHVWAVETSQGQITAALNAYQAVRNGDVTGGSGSGSGSSGGLTNPIVLSNGVGQISYYDNSIYNFVVAGADGATLTLNFTSGYDVLSQSCDNYQYVRVIGTVKNTSQNRADWTVCVLASDAPIDVDVVATGNANYGMPTYNVSYGMCRYWRSMSSGAIDDVHLSAKVPGTAVSNTNGQTISGVNAYFVGDAGTSAPVIPPTNWPDEVTPTTPTPPTLPEPTTTTNPVQPDTPTSPSSPIYITQPTYTTNTYTADLQGILDALDEHCQHLQSALYANIKSLNDNLMTKLTSEGAALRSTISGQVGWLGNVIGVRFGDLTSFLDTRWDWLDHTLDYYFGDLGTYLDYFFTSRAHMVSTLDDVLDELRSIEFTPTDLGGVYSRLDAVSHDLDLMVADVEQIVQALNNLADSSGLSTVRGYLKGIYDWLAPFQQNLDTALTTIEADLSSMETDLNGISLGVQDLYSDFADFVTAFDTFVLELYDYLDTIVYDLEHLDVSPRNRFDPSNPPGLPDVDPGTGIIPWEQNLNLTALRDAVTRLMQKFPFSTINNFVLILTMLVRPAQAPIFDLPLPNPSDWSSPYMVNVDLSIWDVPAAVLRTGIVIWAIARISRRTVSMWTREEAGGNA